MIIWALCGRFCVLMSPHYWLRNGWSSWLCFYMYSTAKSALLCHLSLSHLHLSCTSAKKAFLGHWVVLCSPVEDHFKLKSRDGVFWMEVCQRLSEFAHTQMEKVWYRTILLHNNFFKLFDVCLCACIALVLCYYFFFQLPYHYFSRQKVLTQWEQPPLHYPRSYHHFFFYRYQFDVCLFSNVCEEYVFLFFFFFFNFHMIFF